MYQLKRMHHAPSTASTLSAHATSLKCLQVKLITTSWHTSTHRDSAPACTLPDAGSVQRLLEKLLPMCKPFDSAGLVRLC